MGQFPRLCIIFPDIYILKIMFSFFKTFEKKKFKN